MMARMKTTIEINDVLLQRVKRLAAERNLSLRAIVGSAPREFVDAAEQPQPAFKLRKRPFSGPWPATRARLARLGHDPGARLRRPRGMITADARTAGRRLPTGPRKPCA